MRKPAKTYVRCIDCAKSEPFTDNISFATGRPVMCRCPESEYMQLLEIRRECPRYRERKDRNAK